MADSKENERFLGIVKKETLKKVGGWSIVGLLALGLLALL